MSFNNCHFTREEHPFCRLKVLEYANDVLIRHDGVAHERYRDRRRSRKLHYFLITTSACRCAVDVIV
ncbi:hypothetical protein AB1N83_004827 [Pleurotus pulmonarius]